MKRLALYTIIVLTTLAVAAVIVNFPEAIVLFLLSLALAATARPMVDRLIRRGLSRGASVVITYLAILGSLITLILIVSTALASDLQKVGNNFAMTYDRIYVQWPNGSPIERTIIQELPPPEQLYSSISGEQGGALAQTLLGITSSSFATLSQILAVLVLSIYWTIDRIHFERLWLSLLPAEIRARWRDIGRDIEYDLGNYIRSEVAQSLMAGVFLGLGYWLIGIPVPTLLAVFAALAWLIPWLGGVIAVLAAFAVGIFIGLPLALVAAAFTAAVLIFSEFFIEPRLFHRRQHNSWLSVVFILVLFDSIGLIGVILAPPIATMILMATRRILRETTPATPVAITDFESARQIAKLDERILLVRQMIDHLDEKPSPQTTSMLGRLDSLINEANQIIADQAG